MFHPPALWAGAIIVTPVWLILACLLAFPPHRGGEIRRCPAAVFGPTLGLGSSFPGGGRLFKHSSHRLLGLRLGLVGGGDRAVRGNKDGFWRTRSIRTNWPVKPGGNDLLDREGRRDGSRLKYGSAGHRSLCLALGSPVNRALFFLGRSIRLASVATFLRRESLP